MALVGEEGAAFAGPDVAHGEGGGLGVGGPFFAVDVLGVEDGAAAGSGLAGAVDALEVGHHGDGVDVGDGAGCAGDGFVGPALEAGVAVVVEHERAAGAGAEEGGDFLAALVDGEAGGGGAPLAEGFEVAWVFGVSVRHPRWMR